MTLPPGSSAAVAVGGGNINAGYRVLLADGAQAFVKTRADVHAGEYEAEAAGLDWLREPGALRTPRVLDRGEGYLALEWIEQGHLSAQGAEELGRGLALTHAAGAPGFGAAPGSRAGAARLGSVSLPNEPCASWPQFYAQRRLLPLARMAAARGALSARGERAVARTCERLGELAGPAERPARLHGDLWWGNVLAGADGRAWLIDPWAYGGHREVDLAMLTLFAGAPARVLDAYREQSPLAPGWQDRVGLYQLMPLLLHAALFAGSYGASAERIALRYGG